VPPGQLLRPQPRDEISCLVTGVVHRIDRAMYNSLRRAFGLSEAVNEVPVGQNFVGCSAIAADPDPPGHRSLCLRSGPENVNLHRRAPRLLSCYIRNARPRLNRYGNGVLSLPLRPRQTKKTGPDQHICLASGLTGRRVGLYAQYSAIRHENDFALARTYRVGPARCTLLADPRRRFRQEREQRQARRRPVLPSWAGAFYQTATLRVSAVQVAFAVYQWTFSVTRPQASPQKASDALRGHRPRQMHTSALLPPGRFEPEGVNAASTHHVPRRDSW